MVMFKIVRQYPTFQTAPCTYLLALLATGRTVHALRSPVTPGLI